MSCGAFRCSAAVICTENQKVGDTGRAKVDYDDLFARASRTGTNEEFEQVAEVGRFRITLERAGCLRPSMNVGQSKSSVKGGLHRGYLLKWSGREESSRHYTGDGSELDRLRD